MSNGYGYKQQVSPVNTAPYQGYGYGNYSYPAGGNQPTTLPAQVMPAALMPNAGIQATQMPNANMQAMQMPNANMQAMQMPNANMQAMQMPNANMQAMQMPKANMQTMQMPPGVPSGAFVTQNGGNIVTLPAFEESYVENILRLNRGKMGTFYMTYENNREWNAKIFKGIIEAAGRDHIIISDPTTGMRYLLLTLNLDYVTFDEPIAYEYPFHGNVVSSSTPIGTATIGTVNASR